jgi:hypothetical protein
MVRSFIGYTEQYDKTIDNLRTRRSENAKAFQTFIDDRTKNGQSVSPEELERYRMNLTNGDSYFLSALPSREMMGDIAKRTNQQAADTILTEAANNAQQRVNIFNSGANFIPIDADENGAREAIERAFGPEAGAEWWSKHGDQWHIVQDNKVNEQVSTLMTQPRFQQLQRPEDVDVMYPQTSPRVRMALREAVANRQANERRTSVNAALNALATLQDSNLPHMSEEAIAAQIRATAAANGVVFTEEEGVTAMEAIMGRVSAMRIVDNTNRVRSLHTDLTAQNSPLWQLLEGADGANLNETTILEAINTVAGRHGFRFANIQEATDTLGEDYFTLSQKIRAGVEHSRMVSEAQAGAASRADQISKDNGERLAMAANAAVQRNEIPENGTVFMAIKALADEGFVFADTPDTVVRFARDYQRRTGSNDYTEIKNAAIDELNGQSASQLSASMIARALMSAGVGVRPNESATTFFDDFHTRIENGLNRFYDSLRGLPETSRPNGVWDASIQSEIMGRRAELESDVRTLRHQVTGLGRANFSEFGVNQSIPYDGREMSVDEYINARLQEAEGRLADFDRQVGSIRPEGGAGPSDMPLPERTSQEAFEQRDGESGFSAWRRRSRSENEASSALHGVMQGLQRGTAPFSYFSWTPEDYRRHGFANVQEMEQFRTIIGWHAPDRQLIQFLAANPEALQRVNEAPLNQKPQVLLQIMRQVYPTRDDLNLQGGQNAPALQPGRP